MPLSLQDIELQSHVLIELLKPMAEQLESVKSEMASVKAQNADLSKELTEVKAEYEQLKSSLPVIDVDAIAVAAAEKVVVKNGVDGQSVSLDDVIPVLLPEIKSYAQELVAAIPVPVNGKDGADGVDGNSVEIDDVVAAILPELKEHAAELVAAIPLPEPVHGRDGADGKDGIDGKSIDLADVLPVLKDEVIPALKEHAEELIANIPVPEPVHGKDGADGKSVEVKDLEPIINELVKKAASELPVPKDGADGKDATDITILPEIDFSKSYPRGTWAHHKGGLWKTYSATNGERGWDCVVKGVDAVSIDKDSERDITINISLSNGDIVQKSFHEPVLLYKGIYDEKRDGEYTEGDTVTCGGSVWYCKSDNPGRPSTENRNWQLAVKHGQHGKDGRNGIDFTKPVTIGIQS